MRADIHGALTAHCQSALVHGQSACDVKSRLFDADRGCTLKLDRFGSIRFTLQLKECRRHAVVGEADTLSSTNHYVGIRRRLVGVDLERPFRVCRRLARYKNDITRILKAS